MGQWTSIKEIFKKIANTKRTTVRYIYFIYTNINSFTADLVYLFNNEYNLREKWAHELG